MENQNERLKGKGEPLTSDEDFLELMEEIIDGWSEVRKYDDRHLYYDRPKWISEGIEEEWWDYPDQYERDTDQETICILIEQYLRYSNIVKDTKIGVIPKVDDIEVESGYEVGSGKIHIREKMSDKKKEIFNHLKDYLLKR